MIFFHRYLVENKDVDESYEERRELQQLVEVSLDVR